MHLQSFCRVPSVHECGPDTRTKLPVADCQNDRWQGNEDDVGKTSNDHQIIGWGATVVVEVVDRDNAGPPWEDEEYYEGENHLGKKSTQIKRKHFQSSRLCWICCSDLLLNTSSHIAHIWNDWFTAELITLCKYSKLKRRVMTQKRLQVVAGAIETGGSNKGLQWHSYVTGRYERICTWNRPAHWEDAFDVWRVTVWMCSCPFSRWCHFLWGNAFTFFKSNLLHFTFIYTARWLLHLPPVPPSSSPWMLVSQLAPALIPVRLSVDSDHGCRECKARLGL